MSRSRKQPNKTTPTSFLRIIGGMHRGRKLPIPDLDGLRPTSDRIRETVFNWLQFELPGLRVLDLFAGTGALGLEAMSRQAKSAVFVEPQARAADSIRQSAKTLGLTQVSIVSQSADAYLQTVAEPFDLVFVDPPFAGDLWDSTLATLMTGGCLAPGAFVYVESPAKQVINIPETLTVVKDKIGGNVRFQLLQIVN